MKLTFLGADVPLTKTFEKRDDELIKHSYPMVSRFTSYHEEVKDLRGFEAALLDHASKGHCLLKGNTSKELKDESRAGSTSGLTETSWICLDLDGLADIRRTDAFLDSIPFCKDTDYILQYSCSHGVDPAKKFSAHIFMMLNEPVVPATLKNWLQRLNFDTPALSEAITLTATGMALRWPLDITTCQNDKLLYIAPPELVGKGFYDPFRGKRIKLVKRKHRAIKFDVTKIQFGKIQELTQEKRNKLREAAGLPAYKGGTRKLKGGAEVAVKGDTAEVTGIKEDRGFVYLNLNGGDSWGYYHPVGKPQIIYNFKSEPNYLTKDLLPAYYEQVTKQAIEQADPHKSTDVLYLAFTSPLEDIYYRGTWNPVTNELVLNPTGSLKRVQDFLVTNGQPELDSLGEWNYEFRFDRPELVVPEERFINRYQPTKYMSAVKDPKAKVPATIYKVLRHCLNDDECVEHFLNWLAVTYQTRRRPATAWVMTGIEGTGKGTLFNYVISPIFGPKYCVTKSLKQLEEPFNAYLQEALFLFIDEAEREGLKSEQTVAAMLRNLIVEPKVSIRRMRTDHFMAPNITSVIVGSNKTDPVVLSLTDRRYNVGVFQPDRIQLVDADFVAIEKELDEFSSYLATRKIDAQRARTPLANKAREKLIRLTQKSIDVLATALIKGDIAEFVEQLPDPKNLPFDLSDKVMTDRYDKFRTTLREAHQHILQGTPHRVSREQIFYLFNFAIGNMPASPHKFTSFLKHYAIVPTRMRKGHGLIQGVEITWHANEEVLEVLGEALSRPAAHLPGSEEKVTEIGKAKKRR